ncbi:E3 ubiquitin-protein ligase TRIM39 [Misgurnus anguillicaudatus]|uniref:E3 ubiquitin-protein ligase TRIM39 n=1 Tax=Misgurnus anguillicaudatus TaxID=75329 RepID=UPI003CCF2FE8
MASSSSALSEEQIQCSICLDVFTDPVSTPCGHNFCRDCLKKFWDCSQHYTCPMCKETFKKRPELRINTTLKEIVGHLQKRYVEEEYTVYCDVCTGKHRRALKSCLNCETSFCETHLEPHKIAPKMREHTLIDPVENFEDYVCEIHKKPLDVFCRDDQKCVCHFCAQGDHKSHEVVPLEEESEGKRAEIRKTQANIHRMINDTLKKTEELNFLREHKNRKTEKEKAEIAELFTSLERSIGRSKKEFLEVMEEDRRTAEGQAKALTEELEKEIKELKSRDAELEQILHADDHHHILQAPCRPPQHKTRPVLTCNTHLSTETLKKTLSQFQESFHKEMEELPMIKLQRIRKYAVDVRLNPMTAHPNIILSGDRKQVWCGGEERNVPDNEERFNLRVSVLGEEGFFTGKFYFEVQVMGKTDWDIGVAKESVKRKGLITLDPNNGYWILWHRNGNEYCVSDNLPVLALKAKPQKVGVFVDYEGGVVSFYDVDARSHIYSFTDQTFTEKLYPYACPCLHLLGKNAAPLIFTLVKRYE